ncbi:MULTISPECIES: hypothetical protein [Virgibacillus]|uniref:Uncharacterized protein n=1 Tax=Virgibacillus kapii TaxID=1638645 RepID=A0ABQ2DLK7_9BACI|nr:MULTISPECIES: hypothetical protein [Virgibacillus]EQB37471.1 hypothetical protein M948_02700 [Virgibacillus sp. CM-4]GGJ60671.1 hypothetical protein GCM10007111_23500 [Virgibacillus kapii]
MTGEEKLSHLSKKVEQHEITLVKLVEMISTLNRRFLETSVKEK